MILAGHETTAVALCWSVYLLAQLPEVQERIAHEAASARADSGEEPQLSKLIYTRTVLDEIMRLYPPAYVIVRAARQRDTVAGVELKDCRNPMPSRSWPRKMPMSRRALRGWSTGAKTLTALRLRSRSMASCARTGAAPFTPERGNSINLPARAPAQRWAGFASPSRALEVLSGGSRRRPPLPFSYNSTAASVISGAGRGACSSRTC
jgi:hypothetical protein